MTEELFSPACPQTAYFPLNEGPLMSGWVLQMWGSLLHPQMFSLFLQRVLCWIPESRSELWISVEWCLLWICALWESH